MKIAITGGHFTPAYAVIEELLGKEEVFVIGRKSATEGDTNKSFEYLLCKEKGIPFFAIDAGRLQRALTTHTVPSLLKFPKGVSEAYKILRKEKPDVVVTFGGYVGLSVVLAARMLKLPIVLHEQVLGAGLSSKAIARFASVVCISYESSREHFKGKNVVYTGNPIRSEILKSGGKKVIETTKPIIYITGGSTGSHFINRRVQEILPELLKEYVVVHQSGNNSETNDYEDLKSFESVLSAEYKKHYVLQPFFSVEEVTWLLKNSHLVISRSGINTVTELIATESPALLIPLPYGQANEQLRNAEFFAGLGVGEYILQEHATNEAMLSAIHAMIKKYKTYKAGFSKGKEFINPQAAEKIVEYINYYGRRKTQPERGEAQ